MFPSPEKFMPERFVPNVTVEVPRTAWRPFEKGPRNCVGQELALLESKIITVDAERLQHADLFQGQRLILVSASEVT
ncbi:hypothetical protein V1525DRAFT_413900 [Lipomyces kononenkoae]|uniref:Uncharacterized protein n=1 Tax=Lipomyces kononenkoae TaxID=34357 RepID=A0ACC3SRB0_LIPKO